jgi:hypothetical protein
MNNYPLTQITQKEAISNQDIDPLAILFFFLGALHIYSYLKRKLRQRQQEVQERLRRKKKITLTNYAQVALLALIITGILEISFLKTN